MIDITSQHTTAQFAVHLKKELERIGYKRKLNILGHESALLELASVVSPQTRRHLNFILWYPAPVVEALTRHQNARREAHKCV